MSVVCTHTECDMCAPIDSFNALKRTHAEFKLIEALRASDEASVSNTQLRRLLVQGENDKPTGGKAVVRDQGRSNTRDIPRTERQVHRVQLAKFALCQRSGIRADTYP